MNTTLKLGLLFTLLAAGFCPAQTNNDDAVPATSNVPGAPYPQIHSDLRVMFRFHAPKAQSVGGGPRPASTNRFAFLQAFEDVVINDLIPMIDSTCRTIPDREHRTMAGLSMGGMQTFQITLNYLDRSAYLGGFSGAGGRFGPPGAAPLDITNSYNGVFRDPDAFNKKVKLVWVGVGTAESKMMHDGIVAFHEALEKAGIKHVFYESPGTAHEWQTWRRDLREFAPLLFKD